MGTPRFYNNLHQVRLNPKDCKADKLKTLEAIQTKGINRITRIGKGDICLRKENISFILNYFI